MLPNGVTATVHSSSVSAMLALPGCLLVHLSEPFFACVQVFQLPKALAYPLFYKLVAPNSSSVTRDAILSWFEEKNVIQVCKGPFHALHDHCC